MGLALGAPCAGLHMRSLVHRPTYVPHARLTGFSFLALLAAGLTAQVRMMYGTDVYLTTSSQPPYPLS